MKILDERFYCPSCGYKIIIMRQLKDNEPLYCPACKNEMKLKAMSREEYEKWKKSYHL
jgi:competence CoiA-like predicted nuclease